MDLFLRKRAARQIRLSAHDAIEEGDTDTLREDIIEAFADDDIEEVERRISSGDFYEFLTDVLEEKRRSLARSEVLEFCHTDADPADIGGLDALKHWLNQRHQAFSDEARSFGLPLPRGVLLVGPRARGNH